MENPTDTTSTPAATSKPVHVWLWGVRLSGITTILLLVFVIWSQFAYKCPCDSIWPPGVILPLLTLFPYLLILWRVRTAFPTAVKQIKQGLALAVWWGSFILIILPLFVKNTIPKESGWVSWVSLTLALTQAVLVASAIGTYYSIEREPSDRRVLKEGFYRTIIFLVILFVGSAASLPGFHWNQGYMRNESSAMSNLITLYSAQFTYAGEYNGRYPTTLEMLGPPEEGSSPTADAAGLIDKNLARGEKQGYRFTLTPSPPTKEERIPLFTISARPITYKDLGCRSFIIDGSGMRRVTQEDRAATINDPPVGG